MFRLNERMSIFDEPTTATSSSTVKHLVCHAHRRRIAVDAHSGFQQLLVVGLLRVMHQELVAFLRHTSSSTSTPRWAAVVMA